jgi:RHS repeat-associated protein
VRYLQGPGVDQVLAQEQAGNVSWMLTDHLGTVRDLVNNSGSVVNHFTYDSFGKVLSAMPGGVDTRYKFTGREFDGETGLYYYRARYFDANVGRFIGQDPISFSAGDSNLYRYVGNSPLMATDPSGMTSRNLKVLLALSKGGGNPQVYVGYPELPNYTTALIAATNWFYLITDRTNRQVIDLTGRSNTQQLWTLTAMLRDESDPRGRGRANLRPSSTTIPQVPTIDLISDDRRRTHNTPGHERVKEVKFRYQGLRNLCPLPPTAQPTPEPKLNQTLDRYYSPFKGSPPRLLP